jgi:hypothetical protein
MKKKRSNLNSYRKCHYCQFYCFGISDDPREAAYPLIQPSKSGGNLNCGRPKPSLFKYLTETALGRRRTDKLGTPVSYKKISSCVYCGVIHVLN